MDMNFVVKEPNVNTSKPWLPQRWDCEADVVVIGFGGAGSSAAIAAHDAGCEVLVLEKAPVGGGNTGCCGGGMRIPTDIPNAVEYYTALTHGTVDEESIRVLAESMFHLPSKLEQWGAELEWLKRAQEYPTLPGNEAFHQVVSIARSAREKADQAGGTVYPSRGDRLFAFLDGQVKKRAIQVMFETPAQELIQDPLTKEILGVKASSGDIEIYVKARKAVILASGGFQNNREMLENFLPHLTRLPTAPYGSPYNTGDGVTMASEVGAKLWHMSGVELGMFAPKIPSEKYGVGFRLEKSLPPGSTAIYINKAAKRFMNEAVLLSHRKDLFQVQEFDQGRAEYPNIPLYMVFDETYRKKRPIVGMHMGWWCIQNVYKWSKDNSAEIEQGWITKADTIEELAEKINVDPRALRETFETYNRDCEKGEDSQFGRGKTWLAPLNTGPYYSFFYPLYESASNVPEALAFGIIAGEQAAALESWDENQDGHYPAGATAARVTDKTALISS
jgi:hypothetical protein